MILTQWNEICFVTVRKAYLEPFEEPESLLVLGIAYFGYLVQA